MMLPGLVLIGLGFALTYGPLAIAATGDVAEAEQGLAGGLLNASTQFGGALMLAIAAAVDVAVTGDDPSRLDMLEGYRAALAVPLVSVMLGTLITASGLRGRAGVAGRARGAATGASGAAEPGPRPPSAPAPADAA
jgi:hypothetical protein